MDLTIESAIATADAHIARINTESEAPEGADEPDTSNALEVAEGDPA